MSLLEEIIKENYEIEYLGYDMYKVFMKDKVIIISVKKEKPLGIKI